MYSWIYPKDFNMGILTPNSAVSSLFLLSPFSPWRVEIGIGLWELGEEQASKNVHRPQVQVQTDNLHIPETFNQVNKTCLNTLLLNHKYWFIYNNPRQLYLQEHHPKLQVKYISGLAWAYIFEVWFLTTSSRYTSSEQHTGLSLSMAIPRTSISRHEGFLPHLTWSCHPSPLGLSFLLGGAGSPVISGISNSGRLCAKITLTKVVLVVTLCRLVYVLWSALKSFNRGSPSLGPSRPCFTSLKLLGSSSLPKKAQLTYSAKDDL